MIETQPLPVENFSLGITDFYIDGDLREAKTLDNLFVTKNKKIKTRYGSEAVNDQFPTSDRICKLARIDEELLAFQNGLCYFDDEPSWTEILGPNGDPFIFEEPNDPIITDTEWREHLLISTEDYTSIQKLYIDENGDFQVRNAGLPEIPAGVSITNPTGTGETYLYAFVFRYDYNNRDLEYTSLGPVFLYTTAVTGGVIAGGNPAVITLPTTLATNENFDVANFDIEIYRTLTNGTVFYRTDTVSFGTASYNDVTTDAVLALRETLYTTGGAISYGPVPKAKYVHAVNNLGYYANIDEDGSIDTTKVLQSAPGIVDAVPEANYENTEQPIKGLSSIFDRPLVFCTDYVYRIDGFYDFDGSGGMGLRKIGDTEGCVSQLSLVRTPIGIFWAGNGGFYWSDGITIRKISDHIAETYKTITATTTLAKKIVGSYDKTENRVKWTACLTETSEPDVCFVLDLKFYQQALQESGHACFSTISGGNSFRPTAIIHIGDSFYRGDSRGYILRHREGLLNDVKIDVNTPAADWLETTVIYNYESCFLDFGSKFLRKFVPRVLVSAGNTTNLSLAISSSNDNDRVIGELKPIRYTDNITWGDEFPVWGDVDAIWNKRGLIEEWRRFPAGGLRCNYKQLRLTNAFTQIVTSDVLGTGTLNSVTKILTLTAVPEGLEEYYISFPGDNYTRDFLITASSATTITYQDAENLGPAADGVTEFVIRGYPKGQVLELNGYVIHWAFISKSHTPYSSSSQGSNPA